MFKSHFYTLQYTLFRHAKWPVSWVEKHHIVPWYRLNRTVKRALSEPKMSCLRLQKRVYPDAVLAERIFVIPDLTFLHIYFSNLFCQNIVKKNRKSVVWVFINDADIRNEYGHEMYVLLLLWWIIGCYNMILSLLSKYAVTAYTRIRCQNISRHFILYFMKKANYHRIPTEP